jgi:hypothetical protein
MADTNKTQFGKSEGKRPLGGSRNQLEDNIKKYLK